MSFEAEYYLLDVFTETPYGGNQLAVFPDATRIPDSLFQSITKELNLSETVFLFPPKSGGDHKMRIFTPGKELPTAGHPTVGTAFLLTSLSSEKPNKLTLEQNVGLVTVDISYEENKPKMVTMHQPLPVFGQNRENMKSELAELLSLVTNDLTSHPIEEVSCGNNTLIIPVKGLRELANIKFRLDKWEQLKEVLDNAFVYAFTTEGIKDGDVQGRMFAPEVGILEDSATGSANGPLACYLTKHQIVEMPATSFQGIEMERPSTLYLNTETNDSGEITDVMVGGNSVIVGKGVHYVNLE